MWHRCRSGRRRLTPIAGRCAAVVCTGGHCWGWPADLPSSPNTPPRFCSWRCSRISSAAGRRPHCSRRRGLGWRSPCFWRSQHHISSGWCTTTSRPSAMRRDARAMAAACAFASSEHSSSSRSSQHSCPVSSSPSQWDSCASGRCRGSTATENFRLLVYLGLGPALITAALSLVSGFIATCGARRCGT